MKIESVDFFYLSMPEVKDIGDGSQDALLVRVRAGGHTGWGECEASPLPSIAAYVTPKSHSACKGVQESVLGQRLDDVGDIGRIGNRVRENSLDLLQADHTLSGIDIALWDLLGRKHSAPVYSLLGYARAYPKLPYASQLFGDTPHETFEKAKKTRALGYRAAKFGWGPFGRGSADLDRDHVVSAREGLGSDAILLIDAGTVWGDDVARAKQSVGALRDCGAVWLEEPFVSGALSEYAELAPHCGPVKLAGGEGCHNFHMAAQMIRHAGLGYIQIDTGRIGGITPAKQVADVAARSGVTYVNHTFTSFLAWSASCQPFAGLEAHKICEYPVEATELATDLTEKRIERDSNGEIRVPDAPGLGVEVNLKTVRKFLVETEIRVRGKVIYSTPAV
jgi:L-alanine-DL-glutamate epimerase-like enolase superfamily enzyme